MALKASQVERVLRPEGEPSDAKLIRLDGGAAFPQLGDGQPLFVRSFYQPCVEGVMANLDAAGGAKYRRLIVLGNPGSG